ncbi:MAG: cell division protein ZapA [Hyphomicrobiaceae bacterium]|nr:MAG: cell division protein ZapA [Hyphomicrobiaceae bacterium]
MRSWPTCSARKPACAASRRCTLRCVTALPGPWIPCITCLREKAELGGRRHRPMLPAWSMGQVSVTLNGRTYSLRCTDGEEARLIELATYVKVRAEALAQEFGSVGDDRVLLMAAIMIADELWLVRSGQDPAAVVPGMNGARAVPPPLPSAPPAAARR